MRRRLLIALAVLVVLAAGLGAAYVVHRMHESGNIRGSSTVEFVTTAPPTVAHLSLSVPWPMFGLTTTRTRSVALALRAAVPEALDVPRGQPRRVPAVDRLRAHVRLDELGEVRRRQPDHREDGVEVPRAPLRRRVAGDRAAASRLRLRRLPEPAAVQRADGRPRHERRGDRLRRRLREDPLDEDHRPVRDLAAAARRPPLRRRLERRRVGDRRAQRQDDLALPHRRRRSRAASRSPAGSCTSARTTGTSTACRCPAT